MSTQACHPSKCCGPWAELCCDIGLECSRAVCRASARGRCLALSPGMITGNAALCQGAQTAHITLPACREYAAERCSVQVAPDCQTAEGPLSCIYTTTTKRASACAVRAGEIVTYRITFTNHASVRLDAVRICDDVQEGVIPGSIRPAPGPEETLKAGIAMGSLGPGESAVLTYDVTAHFAGNRPMVNRAWVQYCFTDPCGCLHRGNGGCRGCAVFPLPDTRPICRPVWRQFPICNFGRFRYFYVYHRGADCFQTPCGRILTVKFGIAVKYIDCLGENRGRFFEDSVQVTGLSEDFDLSRSRIRLTDLVCAADDRGLITAGFRVTVGPG